MEPQPEPWSGDPRVASMRAGVQNVVDLDYDDDLTSSMKPFATWVKDACEEVSIRFRFQTASIHNQRENVLMLAGNILSSLAAKENPLEQDDVYDSWTGGRRGTQAGQELDMNAADDDPQYTSKQIDAAVRGP